MKTHKSIWLKRMRFLSTFVIIAAFSKAQICSGFVITNLNPTCKAQIDYRVFEVSSCNTICSGSAISIAPRGGTYTIPAGCFPLGVTVDIKLMVYPTPGISIMGPVNWGPHGIVGAPWPCYPPAVHAGNIADPCFGVANVPDYVV